MHIVLLNQYYAPDESATAQILSDLGAGLARRGHRVDAVCCNRGYADPERRYPARETIDGVRVRRIRATGFGRGSTVGRSLDYLTFLLGAAWSLLSRGRPHVVISLSTPPLVAALGQVLARLRGARSIYWVMDVYPELAFELGVLRPGSLAGSAFGALSGFILRGSDRVVALGDTMAALLGEVSGREIDVIHNWADGETIRPRSLEEHPLRAEWGWERRFVALYSGNMGMAHEFDTVLEAAERLRDDPRVLFSFIGGGPRRAEVEAQVRRRGLANVELRPYVPREMLGQSLTAADVHLVTLRESMPGLLVPSKIYGILAAGRPTVYVGPDRGEVAEHLREGRCGRRIAIGDAAGLAACLLGYARDAEGARREGENARALFDRRFTRQHGLRAFERLIGEDAA